MPTPSRGPAPAPAAVHEAPGDEAGSCAWFGDRHGSILYFGQSDFWARSRAAGGDPSAALAHPGPERIGRFDLDAERILPPLDLGGAPSPGGVWDVLAHENGWVYFTSFFGASGRVHPPTGRVERFHDAGSGLAELAPGPAGSILATRYGGTPGGSVAVLEPDGTVRAEWRLRAARGHTLAPKSVAYDPEWEEVWVTTDLLDAEGRLAERGSPGERHPTVVLDRHGMERARYEQFEIQFVHFDSDGAGHLAALDAGALWLIGFPSDEPGRDPARAPRALLEANFPAHLDFVQEIRRRPGGPLVVTRWSGRVHLLWPDGSGLSPAGRVDLPRAEPDGLYYTGVSSGDRLCATYCAGLRVVCAPLPSALR